MSNCIRCGVKTATGQACAKCRATRQSQSARSQALSGLGKILVDQGLRLAHNYVNYKVNQKFGAVRSAAQKITGSGVAQAPAISSSSGTPPVWYTQSAPVDALTAQQIQEEAREQATRSAQLLQKMIESRHESLMSI